MRCVYLICDICGEKEQVGEPLEAGTPTSITGIGQATLDRMESRSRNYVILSMGNSTVQKDVCTDCAKRIKNFISQNDYKKNKNDITESGTND